jgi:intracellular sulfur oxidation DsrE/DsrF family protein
MKLITYVLAMFFLCNLSAAAEAKMDSFKAGSAISGFGKYAPIATNTVNKDTVFKVAFDVAEPAKAGEVNRRFNSLARFINMHVAAGVSIENIELALVVHGKASLDLLDNLAYQEVRKADNANKALIEALLAKNVKVILCGQSAMAYDLSLPQLIKGTQMELSAMTAHALLQQQGYTVNPF